MVAAESGSQLRIVLLGAPGSGKGTQAALLSERLGIQAISTGEMLRAAVSAGTELGGKVKDVIAAGALVDDELMAEVVEERLAQADARPGFLLDGYPRTASQAETLDRILESAGAELDQVLFIDVPEPVLIERALARKREDDREDVVGERLRVYAENTAPLVDLYRHRNLLREIDGDRSVEEVAAGLIELMAAIA